MGLLKNLKKKTIMKQSKMALKYLKDAKKNGLMAAEKADKLIAELEDSIRGAKDEESVDKLSRVVE